MPQSLTLLVLLSLGIPASAAGPQSTLGAANCPTTRVEVEVADASNGDRRTQATSPAVGRVAEAGSAETATGGRRLRWHSLVPGMYK